MAQKTYQYKKSLSGTIFLAVFWMWIFILLPGLMCFKYGARWWIVVIGIVVASLFIPSVRNVYRNRLIFEADAYGIRAAGNEQFESWQNIDRMWVEYKRELVGGGRLRHYDWVPYIGYITKAGIVELICLRECTDAVPTVVAQIQELSGGSIPYYKVVNGKYQPFTR